ncbi:MAG: arylesterase [Pseudomonadota bacterium]
MRNCLFLSTLGRYGLCRAGGKAATLVLTIVHLCLFSPVWARDTVTVLMLGDSLTQGYGLPPAEGLVSQLDRWLQEQGADAQLVNAGVSGDTTAGGAARVEWSLTPEIDAMVVALGGNDLLRGLDPEAARGNLQRILDVAQTRDLPVLLVGMQAPGNFGPEYKSAFDRIYPDLAEAYQVLFFPDFFKGLGDGDLASLQRYFQPDGIHPNAAGVAEIVVAMGPSVLELIAQAR